MLPTLAKHDPNKRDRTLQSGLTAPTSWGHGGTGAAAGEKHGCSTHAMHRRRNSRQCYSAWRVLQQQPLKQGLVVHGLFCSMGEKTTTKFKLFPCYISDAAFFLIQRTSHMRFFLLQRPIGQAMSTATPDRPQIVRLKNTVTMKCYFTIRFWELNNNYFHLCDPLKTKIWCILTSTHMHTGYDPQDL